MPFDSSRKTPVDCIFPERRWRAGRISVNLPTRDAPRLHLCMRESRDYLTFADILLFGYVDFVALRICKWGQCVRHIRQNRFNRLLVLQPRLDDITKWRDEVEARPLVQRCNHGGSLL